MWPVEFFLMRQCSSEIIQVWNEVLEEDSLYEYTNMLFKTNKGNQKDIIFIPPFKFFRIYFKVM